MIDAEKMVRLVARLTMETKFGRRQWDSNFERIPEQTVQEGMREYTTITLNKFTDIGDLYIVLGAQERKSSLHGNVYDPVIAVFSKTSAKTVAFKGLPGLDILYSRVNGDGGEIEKGVDNFLEQTAEPPARGLNASLTG